MQFRYNLIDSIKEFIEDSILEEVHIGCSGTQVFKIIKKDTIYYLKMGKSGSLTLEYEKLLWLYGKLDVPEVILYDGNLEVEYLITRSLDGEMICSKYYEDNPLEGIKVIVKAFKKIYQVDIKDCPYDMGVDYKLSVVDNNIKNNLIKLEDINIDVVKRFGTIENIRNYLYENKFYDEVCFSHGDISLPNVFGDKDKLIGFIDVSLCGKCDKWFDLAICEKSIKRNYGKEYIDVFYQELGIKPEREKIEYYLYMMELF